MAPVGNPQGQLTLVDSNGAVVLSGTVLLLRVDQLAIEPAVSSLSNAPSIAVLVLTKLAA